MNADIKRTINKKISLLAAVSIVIIVAIAQILSAAQLKTVMTDQSYELLQTEAKNNASIIDNWRKDQADILRTMMESLAYMDDLEPDRIMDYLEIHLRDNPDALMYISDVVHSNTAAAQQTAAASTELSGQADGLAGMVRRFRL